MTIIDRAMHFAIDAFHGELRKGDGSPSVMHAMEAGAIVSSLTSDEQTIAAAILHDVLEDAGIKPFELRERFGGRVAELVEAETENKRPELPPEQSWKIRKQEAITELSHTRDLSVKMIFLGDKLSNMRSFYLLKVREGASMWNRFNQKNPAEHLWYYRSIANAMPELQNTLAWKEYDALITAVFDERKATEEQE